MMRRSLFLLLSAFPVLLNAQELNKVKQPEICFETKVIDFGKIECSSPGVFTFNFTNCGNEVLIIQSGNSSCGCMICYWPKEPIHPGKSAKIELKYDTKRVGPTVKTATIRSNAANEPVILLKIKGTVLPTPMAAIADSTVDFGIVKTGQKLHFDLTNTGAKYPSYRETDSLKIVKIEQISGKTNDLVPTSKILEKGASAQLEFEVTEQKNGTFTQAWKVYFNDGRDPVLLTATGKVSR